MRRSKKAVERQFNSRECEEIARGIETVLQVIEPLQTAMLAHGTDKGLGDFLANWQRQLPKGGTRQFEESHHLLSRTIGLGLAKLLLQHAPDITEADAVQLTDIVSDQRFRLSDRSSVLALFASRPDLHNRSGAFAQSIAQGIRKDAYIEQRGDDYASLAEALLEMSLPEAREYYRSGLSELDKLGSNDYDLIYALLNYAAVQPGGLIRPELGHRLMNLSQTICSHEPSKFGWTLFARASAKSVGTTAATKLVRWGDQEVANFSYGLPQLACFLATEKRLSPQRAAALLTICEDHGWYEWRLGDGVADLLAIATDVDKQRSIFAVVFRKLKVEHSSGGWSSVWESLLVLAEKFPGVVSEADVDLLGRLLAESEKKRDDFNARSSSGGQLQALRPKPQRLTRRVSSACWSPNAMRRHRHRLTRLCMRSRLIRRFHISPRDASLKNCASFAFTTGALRILWRLQRPSKFRPMMPSTESETVLLLGRLPRPT